MSDIVAQKSASAQLQAAVGAWLPKLQEVSGWNEWKREILSQTLWFDDPWPQGERKLGNFDLPADIDLQHAVIMSYYALHSTLTSLRDCEYYFRRYPFRGVPVQKYEHLRYICEMYFGRFYEFKSRIKECFKAVNATLRSDEKIDAGPLVKAFEKEFDQEIRERNNVHHHNRFEDISIDNMALLAVSALDAPPENWWKRRVDAAYRKTSKEWAERVRRRSDEVERYLDAIAAIILEVCPFLEEPSQPAD